MTNTSQSILRRLEDFLLHLVIFLPDHCWIADTHGKFADSLSRFFAKRIAKTD